MTTASIKSGTGITRFTNDIVASVGSSSALDDNTTPRTSSTIGNASVVTSATNGTGVEYREACGKFAATTINTIQGTRWQESSTRDTTNALVFAHISSSSNNPFLGALSTTVGLGLFLNSSSVGTEEASWVCKGTGHLFDDYSLIIVDPSRSTDARQYDNGTGGRGTFDPTDVTDVGIFYRCTTLGPAIRVSSLGMVKPIVVIGGTTVAGSFQVVDDHCYNNVTQLHKEPVPRTHICYFEWVIGDGSTATEWADSNRTIVFGARIDFTAGTEGAHINDNTFGHTVNASASDDIQDSDFSLSSATPWKYVVTGSPSATFMRSGWSLSNVGTFQIDDGFPHPNLNVTDSDPLLCHQPTLGGSFSNAHDAAIESDSTDALINCDPINFSGNPVGIRINVAGDCDLDLTDHAFNGNTYDVEYIGTGTLTVTSNVTHAGRLSAPNGGTITVLAPTTTLVIESSEASALVQIYADSTTQTLLDSGTGSASYTYSGSGTVYYEVKLAGFILVRNSTPLANTTLTVSLAVDEAYTASHGLTYTTDLSYNRSTKRLTISNRNLGRNIYSALVDAFIAESGLRNTEFPFRANGPTAYTMVNGAEVVDSTSLDKWYGAAIRYEDASDVETAWWLSFESQGTPPTGGTGEFQRVAGSGTTDARASGAFNQIVQMYGDSTHGNVSYSNFVAKYQTNGFRPLRVDLKSLYNIATLESLHYVAAMQAEAIAAATGDPAITLTITDHGASPVTWQSKSWSITITSDDTGENILRELNYNLSLDATYQGKDPFNWPEMVLEAGSKYETARGVTEGGTGASLKGVRVITSGGDAHPDFTRFQADDGTYYTPPVVSSINVSGMPTAGANIRLQIANMTGYAASARANSTAYAAGDKVIRATGLGTENTAGLYFVATVAGTSGGSAPTWNTTVGGTTTDGGVTWKTCAVLFYDDDPGASSYTGTYVDGEEFAAGDSYDVSFAELNGATSFKTYQTTGIAGADGFSVVVTEEADTVYALNLIDGSGVTEFSPDYSDYSNPEIDVAADTDSTPMRAFAFYCSALTTSQGMWILWGAVTALSTGEYRNNVSVAKILFDNPMPYFVSLQGSGARWFCSDGSKPYKEPTTTNYGIGITWELPVYSFDGGGGGFTSGDRADLLAVKSKTNALPADPADASDIASSFASVSNKLDTIDDFLDTEVAAIKAKTDLIPADIGDIPNASEVAAIVAAGDDATLAAIEALNNLSSAQVQTAAAAALTAHDAATLDGSITEKQARRLILAESIGNASTSAGVTTFKAQDGTTTRFTSTPTLDGETVTGRTVASVNGA